MMIGIQRDRAVRAGFRAIHCLIRIPQNRLGIASLGWKHTDSNAQRHRANRAIVRIFDMHLRAQTLRERDGIVRALHPFEDEHKFVAAPAPDDIIVPFELRQLLRDLAQDAIASVMP